MNTCSNCSRQFPSRRGLTVHESHCHTEASSLPDKRVSESSEFSDNVLERSSHPKGHCVSTMYKILLWVFALVFVVNVAALGFFTVTVNGKLNSALELSAPQKGTLTEISADGCDSCGTMEDFRKKIGGMNVEFSSESVYSSASPEGQKFIQQYGIVKLPAVVFVAEKSLKPAFKKAVETGAKTPSDTVLVWEKSNPPYFDVARSVTAGLVDVKFLTNKSCSECYDPVALHTSLLGRLGVVFSTTETLDANDEAGKALIEQYSLKKIPAVVLSGEVALYDRLTQVWSQVGTIESYGNYVFRSDEVLGVPYYDLEKEKVVTPEKK
ncbi:hypothetical protein HZA41_01500 [Candidatus Peregrinibacteria bacterium]|nr:hypothetical protein [Candidatus Peregrinibacteria bacterium]